MRALAFIASAAWLASCAAAGSEPGVQRGSAEQDLALVFADGTAQGLTVTRDTHVSRAEIVAAREDVWEIVPDAFRSVGLPEPAVDEPRWLAAVQGHRASSRLGGERLSRYFDCGRGPTGLNADHGRVIMDVQVALLSDQRGGTTAEVRADAVARSLDGARAGTTGCSSSGRLEHNLIIALQLHAVTAPSRTKPLDERLAVTESEILPAPRGRAPHSPPVGGGSPP